MAFPKPESSIRGKRRREEENDVDWTSSSLSSSKNTTRITAVPSETSKWTIHDLEKINISFANSMISSPDELYNKFEKIKKKVPTLNEDFMKIYNYAESKLNFDYSMKDLKEMDFDELTDVVNRLQVLFKDMSANNDIDGYQTLKKTLNEESQFMIDIVRVNGAAFISELMDFIEELFRDPGTTTVPEALYSSLLLSFCKICNFNGSIGVPKTKRQICNVAVVSVPDLVYKKPMAAIKNKVSGGSRIISVAEVKKRDIKGPVITEKRQTRSSSDTDTERTFPPEQIKGIYQHAGQLVMAEPHSFVPGHSLGILLNETKIVFTCLVLTENYRGNIGTSLDADDNGVVYTCGPYDMMKADDRQILLKTFFRLGLWQQSTHTPQH